MACAWEQEGLRILIHIACAFPVLEEDIKNVSCAQDLATKNVFIVEVAVLKNVVFVMDLVKNVTIVKNVMAREKYLMNKV